MNVLISNYINHLLTDCLDFGFAELWPSILFGKEVWMGCRLWEFCRHCTMLRLFVRPAQGMRDEGLSGLSFSLLPNQWHSDPFSLSSMLFTFLHPNHDEKARFFFEKIIMENAWKHFVCMSLGVKVYFGGVAYQSFGSCLWVFYHGHV
jgi:hypothetical protein